jgi:hypothetical protein
MALVRFIDILVRAVEAMSQDGSRPLRAFGWMLLLTASVFTVLVLSWSLAWPGVTP